MSENPAGQTIRILVVDDIPETRENLKKLLYFEEDIQVVGAASSGEEGIELVRELRPDVVLMDINMPGMDGITAGEQITEVSPGTQVIMMSVQGEADYLRRSMLAGAREFLIKPFTAGELVTSIRRVYELGQRRRSVSAPGQEVGAPEASSAVPTPPAPPPQIGKTITVYGAKGGVGASTIVVNVAIAIRERTKGKVAIVDAKLQFGDIGVLLNISSSRNIVDAAEHIDELDAEFLGNLMITHSSGVKVLPSPPRPEMAELVSTEQFVTIMEILRQAFDYIIVDTWTSLLEPTLSLLDLSDRIVLLTTTEIPAIKNAKSFFEVTEALNYDPGKTLLVLNKHDPRGGIRGRDIETSIKHQLVAEVVRDDASATRAVNQGLPIVQSQRNSAIARDLVRLADRLLQELPLPHLVTADADRRPSKGPRGLFARWRSR
jgi:pilus assembly protein CpaE